MNRHERRRLAKVSAHTSRATRRPDGFGWSRITPNTPSRTWRSSSPGSGCVTACYARNMRASLMSCCRNGVVGRQCHELFASTVEERVGANQQGVGAHSG
jgi:hypothetical protein